MDQFKHLLDFLNQLEESSTYYTLSKHRTDMIMVNVAVPGERWEIEFTADGELQVEKFVSDGRVGGDEELSQFIERHILPEMGTG